MKLHDLRPAEGSTKKRKRVGRGTGSGKGKTSGRGTKGQNSRSGGGTRIHKDRGRVSMVSHLPKLRGFNNRFKVHYIPVNLEILAERFEEDAEVTPESLFEARVLRDASDPVVILGQGELDKPLHVKAHRVSTSAQQKIEAAGGTVEVLPSTVNRRLPRS
jgi:large subunit ribosomal protein L15